MQLAPDARVQSAGPAPIYIVTVARTTAASTMRQHFIRHHLPTLLAPLLGSTVGLAAAAPLPDTFAARVEALASMASLNAAILGSRSATATLETWCATHALAAEPTVVAVRVPGADKAADAEQRRRLQVGPDEPIRYRRVHLTCGGRVLSDADNWYVPSRLTPEMNRALDATDLPFGKVVASLHPMRQTFAAAVLWNVLPPGWELQPPSADGPGALDLPAILFEHRAVLYDAQRRPFCEVDEHYTRDNLAFAWSLPSPAPAKAR